VVAGPLPIRGKKKWVNNVIGVNEDDEVAARLAYADISSM
jgi:hypothetical protein